MEYTSARGASWREAASRAGRVLLPRRRRRGWSLLVPLIALVAGLLMTTTAHTAAGTALRDDRGPELSRLIEERRKQVAAGELQAAQLRGDIDAQTGAQAGSDSRIAEQRARANVVREEAGFTALHGPGLVVRLDDAPRRPDGSLPAGAGVDDVVVHQQDVQSVVNALWAGGAEAMSIMDVRVISTSAVRCVGNTLLLHGQVYSPPFVVRAIGDPEAMRRALDAASGVRAFAEAARVWGLGYDVASQGDITVPAYSGSVDLDHAQVAG
ncbi:DUF881 domain-containing protein [Luedemannella helvata]|uniref:DUF881 domain-containing protein n=1 Tax=Luedemannella helvata TaxID=349315 RepID=UPI0031D98FED